MDDRAFSDGESVIVALQEGNIGGYCTVAREDCIPDVSYSPYIGYVFVDEDYTGRRISWQMIEYAIAYMKSQGFIKGYIGSDHENLYKNMVSR